jgi:beta-glucosidase
MGDQGVPEHLDADERPPRLLGAGVDQFGGEHCIDRVVRLIRTGRLAETHINQSTRRLLREKLVLGLFDRPLVDELKMSF